MLAVIGAGPVGLFSVFACGQVGLGEAAVFDSLEEIGGQCTALYPQKPIYDIPSQLEISGEELIANLRAQAAPFAPQYRLGKTINELSRTEDGEFVIDGERFKAVIIAAGIGRFAPNKPPLPGIAEYEETSMFYKVIDPKVFADKSVMILGGGDSAVDWALQLAPKAKKLYIVHRRPKFRAAAASVAKLEKAFGDGSITPLIGYQPRAVSGIGRQLQSVTLHKIGDGNGDGSGHGGAKTVAIERLLVFYGLVNDTALFANWGLRLAGGGFAVDNHMQTNLKGVFAVGDAARYEAKQKLILSGFSEAAIAAEAAYKHIHGTTPKFEYSTVKGKPGR